MAQPTLTPASATSKVILTSTGSTATTSNGAGNTTHYPFGLYATTTSALYDATFVSGASDQVAYTYKKLGGDVLDVELTVGNVYAAYEEACLEYSYHINKHQAKNVLGSLLGFATGTFNHDGQMTGGDASGSAVNLAFPKFKVEYARRVGEGFAEEAGIGGNNTFYSASFALTAAATPLTTAYDVWSLDDGSGASEGQPGTQVHTGSFSPTVFKSSQSAVESNYVFNVTNLKDSYLSNETTRFKVFIRQKDWNPSIYTVANADPQNFVLDDVYFRVMRVVDGLEAVAFGTGSNTSPQSVGSAGSYTRLSYDVSGSYFNLDMSLLEPGYSYEMQFVYFNNNNYTNVKDTFKFRVEEDLDG